MEKSQNKDKYYVALIVMVVAALLGFFTYNKTFPLAEGWYSVYSDVVRSGKLPYKDFEFLYTPLYLYIIVAVNAVFGADIIVLRILGALLFVAIALTAYFIFSQIFKRKVAAIAAIVTVFVMQSEIVQIFYDYIRFYDLFNYLGILFFVKMIKSYDKNISVSKLYSFLSSFMLTLSFLVRQSSGLINLAVGIVVIIITMFACKDFKKRLGLALYNILGVLFTLSLLVIFMIANGLLEQFIEMAFFGALASKGGIYAVMFAWIERIFLSKYFIYGAVAVFLVVVILYKLYKSKRVNNSSINTILFLLYFISLTAFVILSFKIEVFAEFFANISVWEATNILFFINIFICIYLFFKLCKVGFTPKHISMFAISAFIIGTAYGSGTSGGISEGQAALSYGFVLGLITCLALKNKHRALCTMLSLLLCFTVTISCAARKIIYPYSWWGLTEQNYFEANYQTDINKLRGIRVSYKTKIILETITNTIKDNVSKNDTIYCFPQIPIFYYTTDIMPVVKSIVPWFDVATDACLLQDLEIIKQNKPKYIVAADIPEYVIESHEQSFRETKTSAQRQVYAFINREIDNGNYKIVYQEYLNQQDYSIMLLEIVL